MEPWHVNDLDAQLDDETPLIAGLHWGYNAPGCVVWARVLPSGRVYLQADVKFQRLPVEDLCDDLKRRASALPLPSSRGNYASPDLFALEDEPDIGVEVEPIADSFARFGFPLIPAHGDVAHGLARMHDYARPAPDGSPWLVVSPRCVTTIRTLPTLTQKKTNREELDGEHQYAAHAIRCLISSRPAPSAKLATPRYDPGSLGWLRQEMNAIDERAAHTGGFRMRRT